MPIPDDITTIVFDWGDTLMSVDPRFSGPMADWPEVRAVEGVPETIAALAGRYRLAVASNAVDSSAAQVQAALARAGLDGNFSAIFTFAELGCKKPDPAFFFQVAESLDALPRQLVMVGDSYTVDIPGARRAGWRAVWYNPSGKAAPGPAPLHDAECSRMSDLLDSLGKLDLPDLQTCQAWYLEQGGTALLWQHVEAVGTASYHLAVWLRAAGYEVDPLLAHRGGLLHDIAKISSRHTRLSHGDAGFKILNGFGQPALAEISRRHMIYTLHDPQNGPRTWEEKIVHFADKICEGSRLVDWRERLHGLVGRYPEQAESLTACTPAVNALQAEIAAAAGIPPAEVVANLRQAINS